MLACGAGAAAGASRSKVATKQLMVRAVAMKMLLMGPAVPPISSTFIATALTITCFAATLLLEKLLRLCAGCVGRGRRLQSDHFAVLAHMALKSNADSSSNAADGDGDSSSSEGDADGTPAAQQAPAPVQQGNAPPPAPAQQLFPALPKKRKLHDRGLSDTSLAKRARVVGVLPADIVQGAPTVPCACCVPPARHHNVCSRLQSIYQTHNYYNESSFGVFSLYYGARCFFVWVKSSAPNGTWRWTGCKACPTKHSGLPT